MDTLKGETILLEILVDPMSTVIYSQREEFTPHEKIFFLIADPFFLRALNTKQI